MEKINETDALFNMLFGWASVTIAILLFLICIVALRSMLEFKNAEVIKGKIVKIADIGELNLPTVEYQMDGKTVVFKTKTSLSDLVVGQAVDVQVAKSNEARIYDANKPDSTPKIMFFATALLAFFVVKGCIFLNSLYG